MKSEIKIHSECFMWAWNRYHASRGLLCYNLGNSKNAIDGNNNRALGLIKGRSDLTFYWMGRAFFFEIKTEVGRQSVDQINWAQLVKVNGFQYFVIRSLDEFKEVFTNIIENVKMNWDD